MDVLGLNGEWEIIERPLSHGVGEMPAIMEAEASFVGMVPGDVNDSLVQAGRMPEPLVGLNFREFGWVKERSWWFRRRVSIPNDWETLPEVELCLDGLDVHADIWLNGVYLGHHASVFYPFCARVKDQLVVGEENVILVRLTTGLDQIGRYPDFPLLEGVPTEEGRGYPERGEKQRIFLRKPAYVWGWDWGPHLPTCGITSDGSCLRPCRKLEVVDVKLAAELTDEKAFVHVDAAVSYDTLIDSARGDITVTLEDESGAVQSQTLDDVFIQSGLTYFSLSVPVENPRLWWPRGSGAQHLYTVSLTVAAGEERAEAQPMRWGLRTVTLDTERGRFAFRVNGVPIFLKGGNWVPSDSLYGRITSKKLTRLVEEAAEANFNCLRIWGGGRYERDAFYDACDRLGVLVWQDFMSACAPLPAHEGWFWREFALEAEYQIRRLRSRTCLLLWCGNNEVSSIYPWSVFDGHRDPGWSLYHEMLPRMVHELSSHVPYWPTSPYGGQGRVNAPDEGDDHHWVVMRPEEEYWSCPEYWDSIDIPIFNSEYGYGGPCCLTSTRQYMGSKDPDLYSEVGHEHTNTFYNKPRVNFSIQEHYGDPSGLSLEDYILYGALCQGLNLGYSLESLRANEQTMGGIHWMYNDTWGENGWTIIDYYLRRKGSYYNVKRCLQPVRLVLRRGGQAFGGSDDEVVLLLLNDTDEPLEGSVKLGYMSYDGERASLNDVQYSVAPRSKAVVGSVPVPTNERLRSGTVVAVPAETQLLEPVSWRHCRLRETGISEVPVDIRSLEPKGDDLHIVVGSERFAHAVHLSVPDDLRLSDHFFDLLPGEKRKIIVYGGADLAPETIAAVSVGAID